MINKIIYLAIVHVKNFAYVPYRITIKCTYYACKLQKQVDVLPSKNQVLYKLTTVN